MMARATLDIDSIRSVLSDSSKLWIAKALSGPVAIVATIWIARDLGPDRYGVFALCMSLLMLLAFLIDFGVGQLAMRDIAAGRHGPGRFFWPGVAVRLATLVILLAVSPWVAGVLTMPTLLIVLVILAAFSKFLLDLFNSCLQGMQRFDLSGATQAAHGISFYATACALIIGAGLGVAHALVAYMSLALVIIALASRREPAVLRRAAPEEAGAAGYLFRRSVPFGFFWLGSVIYMTVDTVMIGWLMEKRDVGNYQAAVRIVMAVDLAAALMSRALFARASWLAANARESDALRLSLMAGLGGVAATAPVAIGLSVFAGPVVGWVYGPEFLPTVPVLAVLVWLVLLRAVNHMLGAYLSASGREAHRAKAVLITAAANALMNFILIQRFGILGAAYATLAASALVLVLYLGATRMRRSVTFDSGEQT